MNELTSSVAETGVAPTAAAVGVLLVNLGTPDAADVPAVRRYLREFLSDRRVVEDHGLAWKLVLNGIILPFRPRTKARDYQKIWNRERNESPLKTITRAQAENLAATFAATATPVLVDWAMRYGNPSIRSRIADLVGRGCERLLVVPLYPQYSAATSATVCDEVFRVLMGMRRQPTVRIAAPYYNDAVYIDALATSIRAELARLPFQPELMLASFHGMPQDYVRQGDPYEQHCVATTRLLRAALGYDERTMPLTFQSRFGRAKWLEPYTDATVKALAERGVKSLAVVTPGFSADCLETLEEIAVENAAIFRDHGGTDFAAIPCLNDSPLGMQVLERIARRELQGWIEG
ncbi:MAG: ferrochelatase [Hyphomicrobiales bacterium]|nr:ferrochelatase [Hyphomicrobiales bacterium]